MLTVRGADAKDGYTFHLPRSRWQRFGEEPQLGGSAMRAGVCAAARGSAAQCFDSVVRAQRISLFFCDQHGGVPLGTPLEYLYAATTGS